MATKKTKTTRTTTQYTEYRIPRACKQLAFVAVLLMGLGIAIGVVLGFFEPCARVGRWIKDIAIAIGLIGLCWVSYYEARRPRHNRTTWFCLWVVAVILVVVFYILGMTPVMKW